MSKWRVSVLMMVTAFVLNVSAVERPPGFAWARQLGENDVNMGEGLAVDPAGNVYVTGIMGFKSHQDIGTHGWSQSGGKVFLAKYDPAGKLLWLQKAGGTGKDEGNGVAVDGKGNVYVTGYFSGLIAFGATPLAAGGERDAFLAKYDADGKLIWVRDAGGAGCLAEGWRVATDENANIFITGNFNGRLTFKSQDLVSRNIGDGVSDMFLAKYDGQGNVLWLRQAGEMGENGGYGIATDVSGAVYVTGRFADGRGQGISISFDQIKIANNSEDALGNFLTKYDRDGKVLWAEATPGNLADGTQNSVAIDKMMHLYVAGSFEFNPKLRGLSLTNSCEGNEDIFLLAYDANGKVLWARSAGGKAHDECFGLAVDESGYAYVAGSFDEDATFGQLRVKAAPHDPLLSYSPSFIAKYDLQGNAVWVKNLDAANGFSPVLSLRVTESRDIYITGYLGESLRFDGITLKPTKSFWGQTGGGAFVAKLHED